MHQTCQTVKCIIITSIIINIDSSRLLEELTLVVVWDVKGGGEGQ